MGDHYVPQYYLKGFAAPGDLVWVYDMQTGSKYQPTVRRTANENGFYSPDLEKYLANEIEDPANAVIGKIRERETITDAEKGTLAKYIAVMAKRGPRAKELFKEFAPSLAEKAWRKKEEILATVGLPDPSNRDLTEWAEGELRSILDRCAEDPPMEAWLDGIPAEQSPQIVDAIRGMTWRFLTFDERPAFLTCDSPVFYTAGFWIENPTSELTFPLSSHAALWATWLRIPEGYFPTTEEACEEINCRTANSATRYVYYREDESWVVPFLAKGKWSLTRLGV